MTGSPPPLPPDVRALLDCERDVPSVPSAVRGRILARARSTPCADALGGDSSSREASSREVSLREASLREASWREALRIRWAIAAALTCVAGVAIGAGSYKWRVDVASAPSIVPSGRAAEPLLPLLPRLLLVPTPAGSEVSTRSVPDSFTPPHLSRAQVARAELRLLRQARAAVAREDFAAALPPIAEHARHFRDGRLAEEREALRVKSLVGLGRTADARRAAAAFEARFPHSVLQPAVSRMTNVP